MATEIHILKILYQHISTGQRRSNFEGTKTLLTNMAMLKLKPHDPKMLELGSSCYPKVTSFFVLNGLFHSVTLIHSFFAKLPGASKSMTLNSYNPF